MDLYFDTLPIEIREELLCYTDGYLLYEGRMFDFNAFKLFIDNDKFWRKMVSVHLSNSHGGGKSTYMHCYNKFINAQSTFLVDIVDNTKKLKDYLNSGFFYCVDYKRLISSAIKGGCFSTIEYLLSSREWSREEYEFIINQILNYIDNFYSGRVRVCVITHLPVDLYVKYIDEFFKLSMNDYGLQLLETLLKLGNEFKAEYFLKLNQYSFHDRLTNFIDIIAQYHPDLDVGGLIGKVISFDDVSTCESLNYIFKKFPHATLTISHVQLANKETYYESSIHEYNGRYVSKLYGEQNSYERPKKRSLE